LSEHRERLKDTRFDELTRVWNDLSDKEKHCIIRKAALINHSWEVMKSLALLAERLQQKIVDLEDRLKEERPAEKRPVGGDGT
jgi:hypothetical protein